MSSRAMRMNAASAVARGRVRSARSTSDTGSMLTLAAFALMTLGLVMVLSASSVSAFAASGSSFTFFKRQLLWAVLAVVAFVGTSRIDHRRLSGWTYLLFAITLALLVAVTIPGVGVIAGGSSRWLRVGPLSFQPSELAKLALVLFAADVIARKRARGLETGMHLLVPVVPAIALVALLVLLQPDLGTTLLLGSIGMTVLFVGGAPGRHVAWLGAVGGAIAALAAWLEPYRRARLFAFRDPWADPLNTGYQTIQSLIALGSGGWFGVGLGASRQKWLYIPNAHTDFIFAILGEETGLLGTLVVLALFGFLTYLGMRVTTHAPDLFGALVAAGITTWIAVQALVNIGAVTGALPITGVPLPLVSFGGTSLVITMAAVGILVSIANSGRSVARIGARGARRAR